MQKAASGSMDARLDRGANDNAVPKRPIPMVLKLAYRNLFHDRMSFIVTVVGIVFSVVLVAVQCGLYLGSERRIAAVLDNTVGDLWIIPLGTKSFDDPTLLNGRERQIAISVPGVAKIDEMLVSFGRWRKPQGGSSAVLLVGSDPNGTYALPWTISEGRREDLSAPASVAIDKSYFGDLGINAVGDTAEINGRTVRIVAATKGIRSFTTLPFIFMNSRLLRDLIGAGQDQATYNIIKLAPGADLEKVRSALIQRLPDAEILTHQEFTNRSLNYWLFQTGAGLALISGAVLGMIVGVVIVAQTLYSSTKDHINEFATLRALGAGKGYINKVILIQAVLAGTIGYTLGMILASLAIRAAQGSKLMIVMTPGLAIGLLLLTVGMCVIAAISSIFKVIRIDPAVVFSR